MKLIEAYKVMRITWEEPEYSDPINVLTEVRDKVQELPAVKAIPVKWLEAYANNLANMEKANPSAYHGYAEGAEWIRNMIRNWREEEDED